MTFLRRAPALPSVLRIPSSSIARPRSVPPPQPRGTPAPYGEAFQQVRCSLSIALNADEGETQEGRDRTQHGCGFPACALLSRGFREVTARAKRASAASTRSRSGMAGSGSPIGQASCPYGEHIVNHSGSAAEANEKPRRSVLDRRGKGIIMIVGTTKRGHQCLVPATCRICPRLSHNPHARG